MAAFNSSPSSLSSLRTGRCTYEVFLSFRGEDTRNNFVDHLYAALTQRGVHTFKDNETLHRGKLISQELLKAIEESSSAVIIFSENYANSAWCLEELVKIIECHNLMGQRVLPVFYHVDPSDVRRQKRKFGTAFHQQEEKFRGEPEKFNKWREALVAASNLSGFHFSKSDGGESEFINNIVLDILCNKISAGMKNNLIGIDAHMDALNSLLDTEATKQVRMVGIWGMGGIGKTTIARAIFRRIAYKFEGSCFVDNVREKCSNKKDVCALQKKILRDVLVINHVWIYDPDNGAEMIQERLSNRNVLLVLDDVDNVKQIEFLAATHEWFGPGSRIIITTRNEHLLSHADEKYKPGLLLMDQAVELFCMHAFSKSSPPEGYKELSKRAVCYTGGLPLALKVLGSFFHRRRQDVWESALNRLDKSPNKEIFDALKLSFDGLDDSEKRIFLDIACLFKGKDKEHVIRILDSFGFEPVIGITVLIEKSLITVSNERIEMHDLIQEMGWKIVCDSFTNSRIWKLEEMHDLIMRNEKLEAIEALALRDKENNVFHYDEKLNYSTEVFSSMKNLRLLDIYSKFSSSEPTFFPYDLRWLCWHEYPFFSLTVAHMQKLVGLEMVNSVIQHLWEGQKMILPNLKFIDLRGSRCITRFPDVSGTPNIERLILSGCTSLVECHESLGFHKRLNYLDMSECWGLKCLPSRIEMASLETLILSSCQRLERFPEVSPCMVKLSHIYLNQCIQMEELPSSIKYLSGLNLLNLISCIKLKNIPNSICELKQLKGLHLYNCNKLRKLPKKLGSMENLEELFLGCAEQWYAEQRSNSISIQNLTSLYSLRKLDLSWRQIEDKDFPKNFHEFTSLEELYLIGNSKLTQLPAGTSNLSRLKFLELSKCQKLQNLKGLPSQVQVLKAGGCKSLKKIGDLSGEYEWLYKIWLFDCHKLLEDQKNERYIDKMLQLSFLKKCAAVDHRLSIVIPGSNVPSWFKEECHGCNIALMLPPKCHTKIMGFAVYGVFHGKWNSTFASPQIVFKIVNDEHSIPKSKIASGNASAVAENGNSWITYIPFGFFQKMYHDLQPEDWSHIEGNLVMTLMTIDGTESVRCGAHIVYKKDVESIQHNRTCISDYGKLVQVDGDYNDHQDIDNDTLVSGNTYVYKEMPDNYSLNLMPIRTRKSWRHVINRTTLIVISTSCTNTCSIL